MQVLNIESKIVGSDVQKTSKDILHYKFIEAVLSLNVSVVEPYIPENMQLQNLDKFRFLAGLQDKFNRIAHEHPQDFRVEIGGRVCFCCNYGKPVAGFDVFAGNSKVPYMNFAYYIETDPAGKTTDIYICNGSMKEHK